MVVALSEVGQEPAPLVWSNARYLALVESGVIEEGRGVELIDGQIVSTMPQGEFHQFIFFALQVAFESMGAAGRGLRTQPTVQIAEGQTFDPEFALLRPEALRLRRLPRGDEVLWAVEVSVSSRRIDLGPKKAAYARAGVPDYWVVDAVKGGVWTFSDPREGAYREERLALPGETIPVPVLGKPLDVAALFPPE